MASLRYACLLFVLLPILAFGASCVPKSSSPPTPSTLEDTPTPPVRSVGEMVRVVRVIDGDTIEVQLPSGATERVRYIGIDTPERGECYYAEATARNQQLAMGKEVRLERDITDREKFGRLLRYVYVGDTLVEAKLVEEGYAKAKAYPPDTKHQSLLVRLQQEAQAGRRGLWGACAPAPSISVGGVQIVCIFYDGRVPRTEADEYVEIRNHGPQEADLKGWVLADTSGGPSFAFPSYSLGPGSALRVYTNEAHPQWGGFSFGRSGAIWNNTRPETAVLYNTQGHEVSRRSYPPGCEE
ncbi:MAG: Micrococcal nuclease-like protein [Dehalococcoidia bacterium]|nr:Micrococcal nuclease-like protein [Dehalococcoidia bacterium]